LEGQTKDLRHPGGTIATPRARAGLHGTGAAGVRLDESGPVGEHDRLHALLDTFIHAYPSKRYRSALIGIAIHSAQSVFLLALVLSLVLEG
jgi:hypothetical protein